MPRDEQWDKVIGNLAPLTVRNGVYPALEIPVENKAATMTTFLYGILPGKDIDQRGDAQYAACGVAKQQAAV